MNEYQTTLDSFPFIYFPSVTDFCGFVFNFGSSLTLLTLLVLGMRPGDAMHLLAKL
jgi:hypothetical protein